MSQRPRDWLQLGPATLQRSMNRRQLLGRSLAVGLSLPVLSGLLGACEDVDDGTTSGEEDEDATEQSTSDADDEEPTPADPEESGDEVTPEATEEASGEEDERYGGTLNVALPNEPTTLDVMPETTYIGFVMFHAFELLFTWDADSEIAYELAETHEVSDDGLTNTIKLREGVLFHNGEEMTAADVIASVQRWFELSPRAAGMIDRVDGLEQVDEYTVQFNMSEPYGAFESVLARLSAGCVIYPESVIEASSGIDLDEYIGTGPYRLVEHIPDRHIHLTRFDDYVSRDEEPSGYAGRRNTYLDDLFFHPAPEPAAQVSGLQSGEYHYLQRVNPTQFETLEGDDSVTAELLPPVEGRLLVFNTEAGVMADVTMRKAIQACLDLEEMMVAGVGEDYFVLDPGVQFEGTAWYTEAGSEYHNQADPERAQQLAEEAGYDGETIRILARSDQTDLENMSLTARQQLQDAGFNVEIELFDSATFFERREDPENWDLFPTNQGITTDPLLISYITATTWPGWWDSERKIELVTQLETETEFEARYAVWEELQRVFYEEDVPMIKIGNVVNFNARSPRLQGFEPVTEIAGGVGFWNMWLES